MTVNVMPIHELKFSSIDDEFFDFYAFVNEEKYWGTALSTRCILSIVDRLGYFSEPNSIILNNLTVKDLEEAISNLNVTNEVQFVLERLNPD